MPVIPVRIPVWVISIVMGLSLPGVRAADAPSTEDALKAGFLAPPPSARPRVWWHWMNGNITTDGIRQDLQWMQRVGIGGAQSFDAALATPQRVNPRVTYMSPRWQEAFRVAASTAADLGLELSIAGSPGWSESGGPWVKPEDGMKKLVWSETRLSGGKPVSVSLPRPPSVIGPFQNVPIDRSGLTSGGEAAGVHEVYGDVAVIAYRLPAADRTMAELHPVVTSSAGAVQDAQRLWDGDLDRSIDIPFPADGQPAWLRFDFAQPQTMRAVSLVIPSARGDALFVDPTKVVAQLQSSDDGSRWQPVVDVHASADTQQTLAFAAVTARFFRLQLLMPTPAGPLISGFTVTAPTSHRIAELVLHQAAYVDRAEDKAAFFVAPSLDGPSPASAANAVVRQRDVVDLSSKMDAAGTLHWASPTGRWAILRIGYSLLGITNHPASPEGTGLEVDKLDAARVHANYQQYLGRFVQFLPPELIGQRGLRGMVNDSWEAGAQNWTEQLPTEFARRRGYDLHRWLPTLTGRVIDSPEATDRFLWDYRRTLGELLAQNHYQVIAEEAHQHGLISYAESHESGRAFIGDGMDTKRFADVPMSAMWAGGTGPQDKYDSDIRESASVAHLYGQNLVAAESFTAAGDTFAYTPEILKPTADRELANGLNRFVIHTSVHQPLDEPGPGFTLGPFGQWFTRHETWAEQAGAWISYLSRSAFMMQQGRFVADVLYFYGEDSNITVLYGPDLPRVPEGYAYDFANLDALGRLNVVDGALDCASGMHYRVLVLDPRTTTLSLDALRRIRELVAAGASVVGAKPLRSPSLTGSDAEFHRLADELWGVGGLTEHAYGKGRVLAMPMQQAFRQLNLTPDFAYDKPLPDSKLLFAHRHVSDGEVYFVDNRQPRAEQIRASFRVGGKLPELWHADSGRIEAASYRITGDRTEVTLSLEASDAVFVVFRKPVEQNQREVLAAQRTLLLTLAGPWSVAFTSGQGAPADTRFDQLTAWDTQSDPGIRYFSGTARYRHELAVPAAWAASGKRVELDLGRVKNLASVAVNGRSIGVLWKAPFRIDITDALKPGTNQLEIEVTNAWVNRLIGDQQVGAKAYAYTTFDPYHADSPLLESGLLGPVSVWSVMTP